MSDDDISLLSDDGAETKPVKSNAAPSASTSAPKAPNPPPPAAPAKVNKWLKAAAAIEDEDAIISHALEDEETAVARKKKKKKKKKANDEAYDAAEDEGYEEEDGGDDEEGRLKRAKAVDYLSKFSRGKRKGKEGPNSWAEVDESELLSVADNLIQNINRTQKDDILSQIFASTTTNGGSSIKDPLGMGRFDTVNLRLVRGEEEEEVERRSQHRIVNKWHKGKSDGRKGEEGGEEGGTSGLGFALPPEINPSSESFVPDLYLAQFHAETSLAQLKKGMRNLDAEMSEKGRLLKALIKNNFERFISSKGTIDDIYIKLHKMEGGRYPTQIASCPLLIHLSICQQMGRVGAL